MKKLLVGMVAAALMALGLVGGISSPAQAIECPYTGCVATSTNASGPSTIKRGTRPTIDVRVSVVAGTGSPEGLIRIACTKRSAVKAVSYSYTGPKSVLGPRLSGPATWTCTVKFRSFFKYEASRDTLRIKTVR